MGYEFENNGDFFLKLARKHNFLGSRRNGEWHFFKVRRNGDYLFLDLPEESFHGDCLGVAFGVRLPLRQVTSKARDEAIALLDLRAVSFRGKMEVLGYRTGLGNFRKGYFKDRYEASRSFAFSVEGNHGVREVVRATATLLDR